MAQASFIWCSSFFSLTFDWNSILCKSLYLLYFNNDLPCVWHRPVLFGALHFSVWPLIEIAFYVNLCVGYMIIFCILKNYLFSLFTDILMWFVILTCQVRMAMKHHPQGRWRHFLVSKERRRWCPPLFFFFKHCEWIPLMNSVFHHFKKYPFTALMVLCMMCI